MNLYNMTLNLNPKKENEIVNLYIKASNLADAYSKSVAYICDLLQKGIDVVTGDLNVRDTNVDLIKHQSKIKFGWLYQILGEGKPRYIACDSYFDLNNYVKEDDCEIITYTENCIII
jgi:hypothetical protein